ncbi:metal ABC transporter substrate-binding protein [Phycisphaera mikurensis]|uniref:Iron ABC transporter substrate binding protein n=1 Tax=Phycisphaera mikurensis (strain NBRC 102666 / KCTC 22515 / FYK2301M01) TaxID=1142394 RepID=I0IJ12_PHYMF|nr:metal ABC transporter substrate-binding protein [Phycisphaera mikurensis]MBB6443097.1 manganese/iron transport system substrate-binding protein [Phycisphaera mikurensis]BAM05250.1 iron ABC transporter substrate binding protein [Phycisphaera mikurensis NBRC 102666]
MPPRSPLRGLLFPTLALLAAALITGCDDTGPAATAGGREDGRTRVVTTFTILQDMAQNVAGEAAVVESITKPGAEIHEYQPTPLDIVKAQDADLVIRNGMGLERWFEKFMGSVADVPSVDLSEGVEPMSIGGGPYDGKPNPHAWMSPSNALIYVENIRKALSDVDPANAETYRTNAEAYAAEIRAIEEPTRQKLAEIPAERRWLVSSEGAFSYLARDNGMKELFLWPVNADAEGTPQQIRRVVDTIRANDIPVAFSESTISDKPMRQVVAESGSRYGGVLYVDSLTDAGGVAPTYLQLLAYNARTIVDGFEEGLE